MASSISHFRMRYPPRKPKYEMRTHSISSNSYMTKGESVLSAIERLAETIAGQNKGKSGYDYLTKEWLLKNLDQIKITYRGSFTISYKENDDTYLPKLTAYKKAVAEFQEWRKAHAVEIAAHENKLAMQKEEHRRIIEERKKNRIEREKNKLRKQMESAAQKLAEIKAEENK